MKPDVGPPPGRGLSRRGAPGGTHARRRAVHQETATRWSTESHLVFACGRYEGIDQRVFDDAGRRMRVEEVSIGDFVLIGGEVAVLAMIEATVRLMPGVLGNPQPHQEDSFSTGSGRPELHPARGVRDHPYRRCCLGDHAKVAAWRHEKSLDRTRERRPDLPGPTPEGTTRQDRTTYLWMNRSTGYGARATIPHARWHRCS